MRFMTLLVVFLTFTNNILAESFVQQDRTQASRQAIFLLNNPQQREQFIRQSAQMREADKTLRDLAGSEATSNDIYQLAADIFSDLIIQAQGNPELLMQLLQQAQQNPDEFARRLTDEQKRKLSDLATEVENNRQ